MLSFFSPLNLELHCRVQSFVNRISFSMPYIEIKAISSLIDTALYTSAHLLVQKVLYGKYIYKVSYLAIISKRKPKYQCLFPFQGMKLFV